MSGGERRILVVGVGDDGPAGLSAAMLDRVRSADLLVGGRRHLDLFPDVTAERVAIADGLEHVYQRVEAASADGQVVVLASGDPCFYGIGPLLTKRLGRERVEIVPGVSSVALAFARLGLGWQTARVVSAHGRPLASAVQAARGSERLAVLTDDSNTPAVVAEALLAAGAQDASAWVFEHLGGSQEREIASSLASLSRRLGAESPAFASLNVLVVPDLVWAAPASPPGGFGLPEAAYAHTAGMITKAEVRAVSLSKLRLRAGGVLWDVGAGSGAVAVEAAGLVPDLSVFAVERSQTQRSMLAENVAAAGLAGRVTIVADEAPEALFDLPAPSAVFVGGSGGHLDEILDTSRASLQKGGRIVANLVTYEHVAAVLAWATAHQIGSEVVQLSVARGADILGLTRLQAENPVTIVTLTP